MISKTYHGFSTEYGSGLIMTTRACDKIGMIPIGRNGWAEENQAGIIAKTKSAWVTKENFFLRDEIDAAMISLKEKGILDSLFDKWYQSCPYTAAENDIKIKFADIKGILIILSLFLLFSLLVAFRPANLRKEKLGTIHNQD